MDNKYFTSSKLKKVKSVSVCILCACSPSAECFRRSGILTLNSEVKLIFSSNTF